MKISKMIGCQTFPCEDVVHDRYIVPEIRIDPESIKLILISEAIPDNPCDYYYSAKDASYAQTTLQAFNQAGIPVKTMDDLLQKGIYLTTAVKCGKTSYGIKTTTVNACSLILEKELELFPNVRAFLLMGDVAIKAVNAIAKRTTGTRAIPLGATYKIRGREYIFKGACVFPSYLQVGPSFGIEKSKQRMIAEDIAAAMKLL